MKFIIVRHGETLWNAEKRFQGKTDIKLSKKGLKQAKMLAKRLSKEKIDVIYTSMLKRAVVTAEQIQKLHKNAKIMKTKELNELSWGIWEGIKMSEIKKKYEHLYKKREKDRFDFRVPKGESLKMLKARVKKFLSRLMAKNKDKSVLIVSHLNINRVLIGILMGWKGKRISSINLDNSSIVVIKTNKDRAKILHTSSNIENGNLPC